MPPHKILVPHRHDGGPVKLLAFVFHLVFSVVALFYCLHSLALMPAWPAVDNAAVELTLLWFLIGVAGVDRTRRAAADLVRRSCGFRPPTSGYAPCTRAAGHEGPCAHSPLGGGL